MRVLLPDKFAFSSNSWCRPGVPPQALETAPPFRASHIDQLTVAELIDLNNRIVDRLRVLSQLKTHAQMLSFRIGNRMTFQTNGPEAIEGVLMRYNKKTVTVIADDGRQWNVSPGFPTKLDPPTSSTTH